LRTGAVLFRHPCTFLVRCREDSVASGHAK
jgi:hypothetical protein